MTNNEPNRLDALLTALINGQIPENWTCLNRLEQYLICILTRKDIEALGQPLNRLEVLLRALYEVVPENALEIIGARLEQIDPSIKNEVVEILSARLEVENNNK